MRKLLKFCAVFALALSIGGTAKASVPSDLNGDCQLTFSDISLFMDAFTNQQSSVDFDSNGMFDLSDVNFFVADFQANQNNPDLCGDGPDMCQNITVTFNDFTDGDYLDGADENGNVETSVGPVNFNADITFEFAEEYQCGQFATGDWWVHNPAGPVIITRMTPDAANERHGFSVDPIVDQVALDSRIGADVYITPENQVSGHQEAEMDGNSLILTPSDKAISVLKANSRNPDGDCLLTIDGANRRPCLLSAAVLTVLPEPVTEPSLRPPYIRGEKPVVKLADINTSLLPSLAPPTDYDINNLTLTDAESYFGGPWIDHRVGWMSRFIHPHANMRGQDPLNSLAYGGRLATGINNAMLRSLVDVNGEDRAPLAYKITQWGIDLYHQLQAGQYWDANGGHTLGRKGPILYAGHLMQASGLGQAMLNIGQTHFAFGETMPNGEQLMNFFSEDDHLFRNQDGYVLFGQTNFDNTGYHGGEFTFDRWLNNCGGSRDTRNPEGNRDAGGLEIGYDAVNPDIIPASLQTVMNNLNLRMEGSGQSLVLIDRDDASRYPPIEIRKHESCSKYKMELPTIQQQIDNGIGYMGSYQNCCTTRQYTYVATVAKILGVDDQWNNPMFFEYIERANQAPWNGMGGYGSGFGDAMFEAYYFD